MAAAQGLPKACLGRGTLGRSLGQALSSEPSAVVLDVPWVAVFPWLLIFRKINSLSKPLVKPWARPWAGLGRSKNAAGYFREAPKIPKERQIQWTLCALGGSLGRTSPAQGSLETPSDPFHQGFAQGILSGKALGGLGRPKATSGKSLGRPRGGFFR